MTRSIPVWLLVLALGCWTAPWAVAQPGGEMMQGHMRGPMMQPQIGQAGNAADSDSTYQKSCATCHGRDGRGDGPAASALSPKPQDFRDCSRMSAFSDQTLFDAVKGGGQAVGLSPLMPAWGGSLSDEQITGLVQYIRSFCR